MKLGMQVGLGPGHIVLDGDPAPPLTKGHSPLLSAQYLLRPNGWMVQDATLIRRAVGLGLSDIVLDGDPTPFPKREQSPQFSAHVYCGQTAAWIKMPLGMAVGLGPGHIVLDGDPAPLPQKSKGGGAPQFRPICCGQMAGCIKVPLCRR